MNDPSPVAQEYRDISQEIIGAAIEVHQQLGPGLLESVYQRCMELELTARNIRFESQKRIVVSYMGILLDDFFVVDLWFPEEVIVEIKAVSSIAPHPRSSIASLFETIPISRGSSPELSCPLPQRWDQTKSKFMIVRSSFFPL